MTIPKMNISQSSLNEWAYINERGYCLRRFQYEYIDKMPVEAEELSDASKLGYLFEFLTLGTKPRAWEPTPLLTAKTGKPTADQIRLEQQVQLFAGACEHYGITDIMPNVRLEYDELQYRAVVVIDMLCKVNGRNSIIDIKYVGGLYDKTEYGWHTDVLRTHEKKMRQARIYKMIAQKVMNKEFDFYFFVWSSSDVGAFELIKVNIGEDELAAQETEMFDFSLDIQEQYELSGGLEARPSFKSCSICPFMDKCDKAITEKKIIEI